jgi:hypothetical protein
MINFALLGWVVFNQSVAAASIVSLIAAFSIVYWLSTTARKWATYIRSEDTPNHHLHTHGKPHHAHADATPHTHVDLSGALSANPNPNALPSSSTFHSQPHGHTRFRAAAGASIVDLPDGDDGGLGV